MESMKSSEEPRHMADAHSKDSVSSRSHERDSDAQPTKFPNSNTLLRSQSNKESLFLSFLSSSLPRCEQPPPRRHAAPFTAPISMISPWLTIAAGRPRQRLPEPLLSSARCPAGPPGQPESSACWSAAVADYPHQHRHPSRDPSMAASLLLVRCVWCVRCR
ncbi:hypothetical protein Syun_011725 [Stephania yunnanensis]|uniref:Uncharacterized protein n=1 Tax=Stephania yunnanensis TaxID=152371 RepID=A0AAP0JZ42_9MAGN